MVFCLTASQAGAIFTFLLKLQIALGSFRMPVQSSGSRVTVITGESQPALTSKAFKADVLALINGANSAFIWPMSVNHGHRIR